MIKKKLFGAVMLGTLALSLAACGKKDAPVTTVVSSNTSVSSETVTTTETDQQDEIEIEYVGTGEESVSDDFGAEITEMDESIEFESGDGDGEAVIEALEEEGYDTSNMLAGTKTGISGTNVYVMVDGKGLLYDFNGYGLCSFDQTGDVLTKAYGFHGNGTYYFIPFFGGGANNSLGSKLGSTSIGDMSCDEYYNEDVKVYTLYCPAIDTAVQVVGDYDMDKEPLLTEVRAAIDDDLKFFDATNQ